MIWLGVRFTHPNHPPQPPQNSNFKHGIFFKRLELDDRNCVWCFLMTWQPILFSRKKIGPALTPPTPLPPQKQVRRVCFYFIFLSKFKIQKGYWDAKKSRTTYFDQFFLFLSLLLFVYVGLLRGTCARVGTGWVTRAQFSWMSNFFGWWTSFWLMSTLMINKRSPQNMTSDLHLRF